MSAQKITWYRSPVKREIQAELNQRSDVRGLMQALGHLGLLVITGSLFWFASLRLPGWAALVALFIHGTFYAFLLNAFHELCHKTVFKSKPLANFFLYLVSFMSWYNPVLFWASHQEHHKYTLHPPDDLEVILPVKMRMISFFKAAVVNPWDFYGRIRDYTRLSFGKLEGEWENWLFPAEASEKRRSLFNWARLHLVFHIVLSVTSLYFGAWQLPVVITLAPFYGGWLLFLCNNTQHLGLVDNTPDYRLCCRTIILNPFLEFIYWYMNYHTEHHMYAAVPCYNLKKLHKHIQDDLPYCPVGLVETWKGIIEILKKQSKDPVYQFVAQLPGPTVMVDR